MSIEDLIKQSHTISIALPPEESASSLPIALALFSSLSTLNKNVHFEGNIPLDSSLEWIDPARLPTQTAIIFLRELAPFVSKIAYEKNNHDVRLSFALREGFIRPEQFEVEESKATDLTIIVGKNSEEHNQEITFNPHPRIWNSAGALRATLSLLSPLQIPKTKLFMLCLSILEYAKEKHLCFLYLTKKHFNETHTNPRHIGENLRELMQWGKSHISYVVLFDSPMSGKQQGLAWLPDQLKRTRAKKVFGGEQKGNWILFSPSPQLFEWSKIKETITSIL